MGLSVCTSGRLSMSLLLTESAAIFGRGDEGFDHFGVDEVFVELIELGQPEVVAGVVRILRVIWVARADTQSGPARTCSGKKCRLRHS